MRFELNIYISSFGLQSAAGGICVCCVVFYKDTSENTILNIKKYLKDLSVQGVEKLGDILDLEDTKEYYLIYKILTLDFLNWHDNNLAVSKTVDYLVSRVIVELSIGHPMVILCDRYTVNGFFVDNVIRDTKSNNSIFSRMLAVYYYKWWLVHYYHLFNPLYDLNINLGRYTPKHLHNMLMLGLDYRIYKRNAAIPTAKYWLKLLRENDIGAGSLPYLSEPPNWWSNLYPNIPFIYFYSAQEKKELVSLLKPFIPLSHIRRDLVNSGLMEDLLVPERDLLLLYRRIHNEKQVAKKVDYTYPGLDLSPLLTNVSYRISKPQLYNPKSK